MPESDAPILPTPDKTPSSELPAPVLFQLDEPPHSTQDVRDSIEEFNALFLGLHHMGVLLSPLRGKKIALETNEELNTVSLETVQHMFLQKFAYGMSNFQYLLQVTRWINSQLPMASVLSDSDSLSGIASVLGLTTVDSHLTVNTIRGLALKSLNSLKGDQQVQFLDNDPATFDVYHIQLARAFHEIGAVVSGLEIGLNERVTSDFDFINYCLNELVVAYDKLSQLNITEYEHSSVTVNNIFLLLDTMKNIAPYYGIDVQIAKGSGFAGESVIWSNHLINGLFLNILRNTKEYTDIKKAEVALDDPDYEGQLSVIVNKVKDDSGKDFLEIIFSDNGTGVRNNDYVLEHGFEHGKTGSAGDKKGSGTGLARHREALVNEYDGSLDIKNATDDNGEIIGADVILRIPLQTHEN